MYKTYYFIGDTMKNILNYYYGLHPEEVSYKDNKYYFYYLDNEYVFEEYNRPLSDIDCLYKINRQMIDKNILVHEIILNNENKLITYVNNVPFILMEIYVNKNKRITLSEISYINNNSMNIECDKILNRFDWVTLWESKNDYFEGQIAEIEKRYPNLCSYANYYIGLAENAISYAFISNNVKEDIPLSISHKRIKYNDNLYTLYHPLSFVQDYKVRDVSEYIKSAFFNNEDAYLLVEEYFNNNYLSYKEALLFYARLLYPSYFFDMYDDIVNLNLDENIIERIVVRSDEYETFLLNVYLLISKLYNKYIPGVDWIIKRSLI